MKILYIASIRLPTEKAHGIQIMKTCEAFSELGINTTLSVPNFFGFSFNKLDVFDYYGVKRIFIIKRFFSFRLIYLGPIGFFLETLLFFVSNLFSLDFWKSDYIFSRDEMLVSLASLVGKKIIWETHTGSYNFFAKVALEKSVFVVSISQGLKDLYVSKGIFDSKIMVSPDGIDLEFFTKSISKIESRRALDLPDDKKVVMYVGRLDGWKGSTTFLEASKSFDAGVLFVVIGGDKNQVNELRIEYPHVIFLGFKPYKDLPIYQRAADVLVIPNSGKSVVSRLYTSPLKLFAHMASLVPIVASDLPSIREILNSSNSVLVSPDNTESLVEGIKNVLEKKINADILAEQALEDVKKYTWETRANSIIKFILK